MSNFKGGNKFGVGNKFGGGNFRKPNFKSGGSSFERKEMFTVTCSECGKDASVPFKPNGRKPVLCSDCFQKERSSENRQEPRSYGDRNERPSYGDKPSYGDRGNSYGDRPQRPEFRASAPQQVTPGTNYKRDFESLNYKLDKILNLLSPVTQPETVPFVKEVQAPVAEPVETIEQELERLVAEVAVKAPAKKKAAPKKKVAVKAEKAAPKKKAADKA